jgi:RNA polymerase sigma-70 factor (ECF subfamily)
VPAHNSLPWVYGVARGCLANNRRSAARQQRLLHRLALARPDEPSDDGELAEALARLPSSDGEILRLWAWERLEPRDLARALGISANAASIRLHRAKKRLRKLLEARKDDGQTGQKAIRDGGGTAAR